MKKYPREFERYWSYVDPPRTEILGMSWRIKHLCYNAWMAGRRHQKRRRY